METYVSLAICFIAGIFITIIYFKEKHLENEANELIEMYSNIINMPQTTDEEITNFNVEVYVFNELIAFVKKYNRHVKNLTIGENIEDEE